MKKKQIIFIAILSTIFLTTCRKDFPRQMAIEIRSETHTSNSVTFTINVADLGGNSIVEYGVCYSATNPDPTIVDSKVLKTVGETGIFTLDVTDLYAYTNYNFRAFIKADEVIYSETMSTKTLPGFAGTVTDIDGNEYNTLTIGTQVWMAENLKTTRYRDGNNIPNVPGYSPWAALTTGAYCNYNNDANNVAIYGRLYNWYAVYDSHNIAPTGWHVSTDAEWTILTTYLGGESGAGGKLKEIGTTHWSGPNTGAANIYGFSALPGGYRSGNGEYFDIGNYGLWWSSTEYLAANAWYRSIYYYGSYVSRTYVNKKIGYSVRCVKD